MRTIEVFDTTLRDGLQVEGVSATVDDKLRIAEQLDFLGVHYIEGGWPGANPKDIEFFARAATELQLDTSTLVAFGSTRRPRGKVDDDPTLRNLIEANTAAVCIVAKSSDYHVLEALQTTLDEGEAMIADSVEFLHGEGRMVLVDMEHFFDGYKREPRVLAAGHRGGGRQRRDRTSCSATPTAASLPDEVGRIVADVKAHVGDDVDHRHPLPRRHRLRGGQLDGRGRAPALATSRARSTGSASGPATCNLTTVIPNLQLKLGYPCLPEGRIERLTVGQPPRRRDAQPGGQPAGAVRRLVGVRPQGRPARVARSCGPRTPTSTSTRARRQRHALRRVSEMAGRATIQMKADEIGIAMDGAGDQRGRSTTSSVSSTRATTSRRPMPRSNC